MKYDRKTRTDLHAKCSFIVLFQTAKVRQNLVQFINQIYRIPLGARFFAPVQTGPGANSLLYNGNRVFPGRKAAAAWR